MPNKDKDLERLYQGVSFKNRLFLKLLMKLPNPDMPFFILKRFPVLVGIYYSLALPFFVFLSSAFTLWLFTSMTVLVGFPLNVIIGLILPGVVFAFFIRIQLERTINWWRSVFGKPVEWNVSKSVEELVELLKKQQRKTREK